MIATVSKPFLLNNPAQRNELITPDKLVSINPQLANQTALKDIAVYSSKKAEESRSDNDIWRIRWANILDHRLQDAQMNLS